MNDYSESMSERLIEVLSEISYSLRRVHVDNRFDYERIKQEYKNAVFEVIPSRSAYEYAILSSLIKNDELLKFFEEHACCWVNYIGCDSFSEELKRQVFFSSILMEVDDVSGNKELLDVNDKVFRIYNEMLDQGIPVDLWVQLFFYDSERFITLLKNKNGNHQELLDTFNAIQSYGMVVPVGIGAQNSNQSLKTLLYDCDVNPVTSSTVEELRIKKDEVGAKDDEVLAIVESIHNERKSSTSLSKTVFRLNKSLHRDVRFVYYLPAKGPDGAVGLIVYGAKRELHPKEIRDIQLHGYSVLFPFVSAYKSLWENERSQKEAIKSAMAAIMSRNMSHNLGSHYLYYTKAYLDTLASSVNSSISPDIRGAARVLGYMQARMDYLATIISNDKYPYGPVNFKSQLYDELTIDDFSKRHFPFGVDDKGEERSYKRITNFLLSNLVLSEDFTRPGILSDDPEEKHDQLRLQVKYQYGPNQPFKVFTGTDYDESISFLIGDNLATIQSEAEVKNAISSLDIAMPGGIMSCHAFFNVIENFIRNSAKYSREDFETLSDGKTKVLTVTIAIRPDEREQTKDGGYRYYDFIIYDNKKNATFYKKRGGDKEKEKTLYESMVDKLGELKILNDSFAIEKENKGLKEMLFSSAWMRAYTFGTGKTFTDIIAEIQNAESDLDRLNTIKAHCFDLVAVEDNEDGDLEIFEGDEVRVKASDRPVNLGLLLKLPLFRKKEIIDGSLEWPELVANSLDVYADIVEVKERTENLSKIYTRVFVNDEGVEVKPVDAYKKILRARFKDFDKYRLVFGTVGDPSEKTSDSFTIKFTHHLSSTVQGHLKDQAIYAYSDTESGGNFTKTMNELFEAGLKSGANQEEAEYFRLKIRESALTRITLIDERLHKNMMSQKESDVELALKNIRVLNYVEPDNVSTFMEFFKGNSFYDVNNHYPTNPDYSHFVSIHLGLIEKIISSRPFLSFSFFPFKDDVAIYGEKRYDGAGNQVWATRESNGEEIQYPVVVGPDGNSRLCCGQLRLEDKAKVFMHLLRDAMGGSDCYVTIHSGRGNYSKELEGPLDSFPFVSLSSIESAFNNSKMLLSQLFYNTRYVGKGVYNSKNKKV